MCTFGRIFGKSSLEAPVATCIGMDNTDNIPGEYVMPGVPAVASRAGHDTSRRPRELPNINENESKSMKNNEKQ